MTAVNTNAYTSAHAATRYIAVSVRRNGDSGRTYLLRVTRLLRMSVIISMYRQPALIHTWTEKDYQHS